MELRQDQLDSIIKKVVSYSVINSYSYEDLKRDIEQILRIPGKGSIEPMDYMTHGIGNGE